MKQECHPEVATRPKDLAGFKSVLLGVMVILGACGTKDAPGALVPEGDVGRVRFVNLITDPTRNPVNAILESVPFGVNLTYTATTPNSLAAPSTAPYDAILTGNRTLLVKRTADTSVTLASIAFTVATDEDKTVYATGGTGGAAVSNVVTTDLNPAALATEVRMRIVNMSPGAGPVDVFVTAAGADLTAATPDAAGLAVGTASAYFTKAPATYTVRFVPAGTAAAARNGAVVITLAATAFAGGTGRSVVAADNTTGGAPLRAFVLVDR